MRSSSIVLGLIALAAVPRPAGGEPLACRREIAKQSARYLQAVTKARGRCADRVLTGRLPPGTDCRSEPTTALRIASAAERANAGVAQACCGADGICGTAGDESLAGLGWEIFYAQRVYRSADLYAGLIVLGIVGFAANYLLQRLERQALPWRSINP